MISISLLNETNITNIDYLKLLKELLNTYMMDDKS